MSQTCKIIPTPEGGYMVSGDFELAWPSGNPIKKRSVVYLCRCGQSQDKPFCDGSHKKVGFSSQEGDATAHRD